MCASTHTFLGCSPPLDASLFHMPSGGRPGSLDTFGFKPPSSRRIKKPHYKHLTINQSIYQSRSIHPFIPPSINPSIQRGIILGRPHNVPQAIQVAFWSPAQLSPDQPCPAQPRPAQPSSPPAPLPGQAVPGPGFGKGTALASSLKHWTNGLKQTIRMKCI